MFGEHAPLAGNPAMLLASHIPLEYGLEWGSHGPDRARRASGSVEAQRNPSKFGFQSSPYANGTREPSGQEPFVEAPHSPDSCLDVGVMFDVCLPNNQALAQAIAGDFIGSDFADVVPLHEDWVALFLGDVRGKGTAAPLAVPQALYALRHILHDSSRSAASASSRNDPAHALNQLNRHLCGPALPAACASLSLSLVVLNTQTGEALCASAGGEPPLILRTSGQVEAISPSRTPLATDISRTYRSVEFTLAAGEALLLATDGATTAQKALSHGSKENGSEETGKEISKDLLRDDGLTGLALEAFGRGGSPGRMARAVLSRAREYAGGTFHDHASVLVAARR